MDQLEWGPEADYALVCGCVEGLAFCKVHRRDGNCDRCGAPLGDEPTVEVEGGLVVHLESCTSDDDERGE